MMRDGSWGFHLTGLPALAMIVIWVAVLVVPFWMLWKRTGHSGWIALLMLIPGLNLILLYVLAFKDWPALPRGGRS